MEKLYETLEYEIRDQVGILTISRPEALNALNIQVVEELEKCVASVEADAELRVLIITGSGRSFVAGADIKYQQSLSMSEGREWGRRGSALMRRIEQLEIPVIAAVNGFALGGGNELAMACDIILASEKAKFGQPEVGLGITPGFSGTQRLPRRISVGMAKELIYTGAMITAEKALQIGLVNAVYPPEELMDRALELASAIKKNAPMAVKFAKACIDRGLQMDLDSGIAFENEVFAMCYATEDQKEGMKAFLEKRPAVFRNK